MKTNRPNGKAQTSPAPGARIPLTDRDRLTLRLIQQYWEERGYAPSVRALAAALGTHSTSVARYRVLSLERRALLVIPRENGEMLAHTMRLTSLGRSTLDHYTDHLETP